MIIFLYLDEINSNMRAPLLLLLCIGTLGLSAQDIKGIITDTASGIVLENATVCVLNAKDSTLNRFTRAGKAGSFSIKQLEPGPYLLLVSYPGYADYVESFSLDVAVDVHDFKQVPMILKAKLLEQVIVTGSRAAIRMNGDTTEYNASSFVIKPGDRVEDLLKQLPGIQVDKDGKITAQGKAVNKVLVDGEEFFGDDPTLVTKNIRSDMVDKVQLFDKKSDQAVLTGIDDGIETKTINIKLKEDKKNGYFGKVEASGGTDKFYQPQVMFNSFKGKRKLSAYGILSNTGKIGMDFSENANYGFGGDMEMLDGGLIQLNSSMDGDLEPFNGRFEGAGIPVSRSGGIHFDNKWHKDERSINTTYKIGSVNIGGINHTLTQNNLPSGIINTDALQSFNKSMFRNKLEGIYTTKLDSTANLKVTVEGISKNSKNDISNLNTSYRSDGSLLNQNSNELTNNGFQHQLNARALYTKKFKKPGRTVSALFSQAIDRTDMNGFLHSKIDFYDKAGGTDSTQLINQYKTNKVDNNMFHADIDFSESFSKTFSVWFQYDLVTSGSHADRRSYNQATSGKYDALDSSVSNEYQFNQLLNRFGAIFNYKKNKSSLTFGTRVGHVLFRQNDLFAKSRFQRNFINWEPQIAYKYRQSGAATFRVNYTGNVVQPDFAQIQPIRQNTDPLNIYLGNPGLRPSFNNRFNISYDSYKVLSEQSMNFSGSYSFTTNGMVDNTVTDASGKTTSQTINLTHKNPFSFGIGIYTGKRIKKIGVNVNVELNANGNTLYNYANNVLNTTRSYTYGGNLSLSKFEKEWNGRLTFGSSYTVSQSSLQKEMNDNGAGFNSTGFFNIPLPGKIEIGADANYTYRAKTQSFNEDFRQMIVNARIARKFLKDGALKIEFSGNDLLNQNAGFSRSANNNQIIQRKSTTIRRYFLFSLIYDLNKMGGTSSK